MKIFIVGLGLMGASYAQKLTEVGHEVYGYDKDSLTNQKALKEGIIKSFDLKDIVGADLVILALYPTHIIDFVEQNIVYFKDQLITDISGTKVYLLDRLLNILPKTVHYVSHHPMAGREKSGYDFKDITMFKDANFLIIDSNHANQEHIEVIKKLGKDLGFKRQLILSAKAHDMLIAHTSQLTHLLAVGLMLMDTSDETKNATGDSFRDLTRIANINETLWSELFLENKTALVEKIDDFMTVLKDLKSDIINDDEKSLKEKLIEARKRRLNFDENNTTKL